MCGIVALLSRPSQRPVPTRDWLFSRLDAARADRQGGPAAVAGPLEEVDAALKGLPGVRALVGHPEIAAGITARLDLIDAAIAEFERNEQSRTGIKSLKVRYNGAFGYAIAAVGGLSLGRPRVGFLARSRALELL